MMGAIVIVLAIIGIIVLVVALVLVRLLTRRQDSTPPAEEALLVQEICRTLDRLEKRVDVLETLLTDKRPSSRYNEDYNDVER